VYPAEYNILASRSRGGEKNTSRKPVRGRLIGGRSGSPDPVEQVGAPSISLALLLLLLVLVLLVLLLLLLQLLFCERS